MWVDRLAGGEERARLGASLDATWPYALGILDGPLRERFRERVAARLPWFDVAGDPASEHARGTHTPELAPLWDEMTMVRRSVPGAQW
jgi:1,2-phenylacetyl-CoA epoxidase catalytic subunit